MTPAALLLMMATADAVPEPEPEPEPEYVDEYSDEYQIKKRGIPTPPSQDRKAYLAWKKRLSKRDARKVDTWCHERGGDYQDVCNGIGPLAIGHPPRLTALNGETLRTEWFNALTRPQQRYVTAFCEDEANGFSELCGGTPIVLAFDSERVQFTAGESMDWPTATTPWLARDVNGDGQITDAGELFGSSTVLPDGSFATHGFVALRALDANGDGTLDARDPAFSTLVLWADRDGNRASSPDELTPATNMVVALSLADEREATCDARGNCEGERAALTWRDATGAERTGAAIDVYLRLR